MVTFEELKEKFDEWHKTNKDIAFLWKMNTDSKADYLYADMYAKGIAQKWAELLQEAYGADVAIELNSNIEQIAVEVARAYGVAYKQSAYYAKNVQENMNEVAQIGLKAIEPKLDQKRLSNLIDKMNDATTRMAEHLLQKNTVETITRTAVSDTIEANARFHKKAGLHTYMERTQTKHCCKWCQSKLGRYEFGEQPSDFFAIHANCSCQINYSPSKYKLTNIRYETQKIVSKGKTNYVIRKVESNIK